MARLRDYQWNQWVLDHVAATADPFIVIVGDLIGGALRSREHHISAGSTRAQFVAFCQTQGVTGHTQINAARRLYSGLEVAKNARRRSAVALRTRLAKERATAKAARQAELVRRQAAQGVPRAANFDRAVLTRRVFG